MQSAFVARDRELVSVLVQQAIARVVGPLCGRIGEVGLVRVVLQKRQMTLEQLSWGSHVAIIAAPLA